MSTPIDAFSTGRFMKTGHLQHERVYGLFLQVMLGLYSLRHVTIRSFGISRSSSSSMNRSTGRLVELTNFC